jgi:hypothetical protein
MHILLQALYARSCVQSTMAFVARVATCGVLQETNPRQRKAVHQKATNLNTLPMLCVERRHGCWIAHAVTYLLTRYYLRR